MEKVKKIVKETWSYILIIIIVLLVKIFVISPIMVHGTSMINTLHDKDIMLLNKLQYSFNKIKRFDIVVISTKEEYLIKRVIGLPGEKIEYKNNKLYVNGNYIKEKFSHKKTEDFSIEQLESKTVPNDYYLVLGDNRTNSVDSRIIGFISKDKILGKTNLTIFPFSRIGKKK